MSKKVNNPWRALGLVSVIGADLAICIIAGVMGGKYLDNWLHTSPWIMMVGLFLGLGAGIISMYHLIRPYL
ncbi:AtpZ/AtpI family protein [Brevibacillus daliensis]|uniref:AtpZ/AtpI family protein n=1 Tax=Brevibacillus daliensis TaxID=2892995 RepID=UPI001E6338D5|nr:AtpZ/AtpI family protein [Brevibacillus daliensis]